MNKAVQRRPICYILGPSQREESVCCLRPRDGFPRGCFATFAGHKGMSTPFWDNATKERQKDIPGPKTKGDGSIALIVERTVNLVIVLASLSQSDRFFSVGTATMISSLHTG